jgi:hypothetical protein
MDRKEAPRSGSLGLHRKQGSQLIQGCGNSGELDLRGRLPKRAVASEKLEPQFGHYPATDIVEGLTRGQFNRDCSRCARPADILGERRFRHGGIALAVEPACWLRAA